MLQSVKILFYKELTLELRRKSVVFGLGLYLLSLIFICYLTFRLRQSAISETTWSALFWLTILFSLITTVAKSFISESPGLTLYYYSIASPQSIIVSKIIYNTLLCFILSLAGYGLFNLFIGAAVSDQWIFVLTLLLTSFGFAAALSLMSGISSRTNNSSVLMAVLSFPILISILLMAIRITSNVVDGLDPSTNYDELTNLLAINCILGALAYLLFPYIWRS